MSPINACWAALLLLSAGWVQAEPEIQHWRTDNGARVYFVQAGELPMADVRVVFNAGAARDEGKPGQAVLTNAMLPEGAGTMDADAIAERFESLGADFSVNALRDMAIVSLRSLNAPELLQPALETLALVIGQPTFPEEAWQRERARMLVALRQQKQSPGTVADKAFYAGLYETHPYATPPLGDEQSVSVLERADLINFYRRYYVASNAVVAIVGDLDRERAEAIARSVVGGLPAGQPAPPLPAPAPLSDGREVHIAFPSSQTHLVMGQLGMRRDDPDYFPLYVGNHVLGGGGLVSRISEEVREKRGLSYSAYSQFVPMQALGPFELVLQTRNDSTGEALRVLRETLARFVEEGPTAAELEAAQKNLTGSYPLSIDSNSDIVQYLAVIGFYRLPLDYLNTFPEKVRAVTVEQVRDAFSRRIHPDRLLVVTVGNAP